MEYGVRNIEYCGRVFRADLDTILRTPCTSGVVVPQFANTSAAGHLSASPSARSFEVLHITVPTAVSSSDARCTD